MAEELDTIEKKGEENNMKKKTLGNLIHINKRREIAEDAVGGIDLSIFNGRQKFEEAREMLGFIFSFCPPEKKHAVYMTIKVHYDMVNR